MTILIHTNPQRIIPLSNDREGARVRYQFHYIDYILRCVDRRELPEIGCEDWTGHTIVLFENGYS